MSLTTNLRSKNGVPTPSGVRRNGRICSKLGVVGENCYTLKNVCDEIFPEYVLNQELVLYLMLTAIVISTLIALVSAAMNEYLTRKHEQELQMLATSEGQNEKTGKELAMLECYDDEDNDDPDDVHDESIWAETEGGSMDNVLSSVTLVPTNNPHDEQDLLALAKAKFNRQWAAIVKRNKNLLKQCIDRVTNLEIGASLLTMQNTDTGEQWRDVKSADIELTQLSKSKEEAEAALTLAASEEQIKADKAIEEKHVNSRTAWVANASANSRAAPSCYTRKGEAVGTDNGLNIIGASEDEIDA